MELGWTDFKTFVTSRGLSIQWVVAGPNYFMKAFDNIFSFQCLIPTDNTLSSDTVDFETNFKAAGNIKPLQTISVQSAPLLGQRDRLSMGSIKSFLLEIQGFSKILPLVQTISVFQYRILG